MSRELPRTGLRAEAARAGVEAERARLSAGEWLAVARRAGAEFLADDCTGLARQMAYSSLLAFFPAAVFVVGALGLLSAYDALRELLSPVAPGAVLATIEQLRRDSAGTATSAVAFALGAAGAVWAASGAMGSVITAINRAHGRVETRPFWQTRAVAIPLVAATAVTTAGLLVLVVFGGPLGEALARRVYLGGAFDVVWAVARWPLAFCAGSRRARSSAGSPGSRSRASSRSTRASRTRTRGRTARSPAASFSCCG